MADYLTDEEQAERLKRWWDRNGTSLVLSVVVAVGAVLGWRYYQSYTEDRANAASAAYMAYLEAQALGEPVADLLAVLDTDHVGSAYHVFALLHRAAAQAEEKDWEEAFAYLERAVALAQEGLLADVARYRAAQVLYQLDRLDDALEHLAKIKGAGFQVPVADLSGDIHVAQEDVAAARSAYQAGVEAAQERAGAAFAIELLELKLASLADPP